MKKLTMVEVRNKINQLGVARSEYPCGTPEYNAANAELMAFTKEQLLSPDKAIANYIFGELCEECGELSTLHNEYPEDAVLSNEIEHFRSLVYWMNRNNLHNYSNELLEALEGKL